MDFYCRGFYRRHVRDRGLDGGFAAAAREQGRTTDAPEHNGWHSKPVHHSRLANRTRYTDRTCRNHRTRPTGRACYSGRASRTNSGRNYYQR
jgi:hypothetical protein